VCLQFSVGGHYSQSGGYYSLGAYSFNSKVGSNRLDGRLEKRGVSAAEVEPLGFNRDRKIHGRSRNPDAEAG